MKSTSKMMVIAAVLLLAAAMLVMPASARAVANGGTVFDYETGLDLSGFVPAADQLAKYTDDDPTKGQIYSIPLGTPNNLNLIDIDMQGNYGTYYVVSSINPLTKTGDKIYIRDPAVSFNIVLAADDSSSIAGKTVTKTTPVLFKFTATEVGTYLNTATVNVEIVTPGGGTIRQIGAQNFMGHVLSAPTTFWGAKTAIDISTLEAGTYTAKAVWQTPTGFADYATDSSAVSFTVSSKEISIVSNKENVVRNNPFVVTVTGDSKTKYYLFVKDASVATGKYPTIKAGQPGVFYDTNAAYFSAVTGDYIQIGIDAKANADADSQRAKSSTVGVTYEPNTAAVVETNAGGSRSVEFATDSNTDDKTFTIKIINPDDASKYDEVKVKVEEGEVTITAEGAGTYYLGEEVKLSGTNTDSDNVFLFMTGPNLGTTGQGVKLDNTNVNADDLPIGSGYIVRDVDTDDTWQYRWDTSSIAGSILDAGTYTIYACSKDTADNGKPVSRSNLAGVKYQTFGIAFKSPYLSLNDIGAVVAKGDKLKITGIAEGKPDKGVQIWIFGKNYRNLAQGATVEDDGSFEYTLERTITRDLATGQYFVVVQHPMTDGNFNVDAPGKNTAPFVITTTWGTTVNIGNLAASEAATALTDLLNSPNCDDTYRKVSFTLEEAWIRIDAIGDKAVGDKFTLTGTTNLAVGNELMVDVNSASFTATTKDQAASFSGASGTVAVAEGTDYNTWSFAVDASSFKADQYTAKVESIDADVSTSTTFNVLEGVATTVPATTAPVTTAPETTAPATTAPATTPVSQPGFGALISLVGLGAVAFLVMRRN